MAKKWSEDSRRRQSESIKRHKPWELSGGPVTDEGKSRSAKNADKGKAPLRMMLKMVRQVHRERLELVRWLEKTYGVKVRY